jgi:hypothetical protein
MTERLFSRLVAAGRGGPAAGQEGGLRAVRPALPRIAVGGSSSCLSDAERLVCILHKVVATVK